MNGTHVKNKLVSVCKEQRSKADTCCLLLHSLWQGCVAEYAAGPGPQ